MKTKLHLLLIAILFGYSMNAQVVTITGNGTGGWVQPGNVVLDDLGGGLYSKAGVKILGTGGASSAIKFSEDGSWGTTGGYDPNISVGWPNGTVILGGGTDIPAEPGFWDVTYNSTTKEYTFVAGVDPNRSIVFSGAGLSGDVNLNTTNNQDYTVESVSFATGGNGAFIEVASPINPTPTANWSSVDFPSGVGTQDGTLIPVAPGNYFIFFDANSGAYDFVGTTVSIIGGFAQSNWSTDIDMETTDNIIYTLSGFTFAAAGELKFRDNHSWSNNFGASSVNDFPTGTAAPDCCELSNIHFTAGTYNITFNRITLEYSFESLNANVEYVGTTSTPATISLGTTDGTNYTGQELSFAGAGSGDFNEVASILNPGPTFFTWPAVTSPASGFWNVAVDISTGVNSFTPTVVGLIGDFSASNWGTDIDFTSVDGVNYTLDGVVFDKAGRRNFKIRDNHSWSVQFGHDTSIPDPGTSPLSGTLTNTATQDMWLEPGTYNFTFNRVTFAYTISDATLAVNKFEVSKFSVYPNPTHDTWKFVSKNNDKISSLSIIDILGKTVMSIKASSKEVSVNASSLSKGMYFAKVSSGDSVQTFKLLKN